tara:strand:+ start:6567 stop:7244 length:678 start_codon:yes stop_codon:yes gene_type:complete
MKKISCIIPTYNREEGLKRRILELLENNYSNLEIIVVNDGGKSPNIETSETLKVINLDQNSGSVSIPRNVGITHSTGDYICHVDDDVAQHPDKLRILSEVLDNTNSKLCFGQKLEYKSGVFSKPIPKLEWEPNQPQGWGVDNGQIMYRRDVYDSIDLVFCKRACDWELAKKIREVSETFVSVNKDVCTYYWHDSNRSLDESTKVKKIYPGRFRKYFKWGVIPEEA